jgi:hypothetical protein
VYSELLPQRFEDEMFKKFIMSISNSKTIESIKLMNFLYQRKNPKYSDLTFEQDLFMEKRSQEQEERLVKEALIKSKLTKQL